MALAITFATVLDNSICKSVVHKLAHTTDPQIMS